MSLIVEIKLIEKSGKHKTEVKVIREVKWIVPDPRTQDVNSSARATKEVEGWDLNVINKLELHVMQSVAPELMTHVEEDENMCWFYLTQRV